MKLNVRVIAVAKHYKLNKILKPN